MGLLLAVIAGAAIGALARLAAPALVPRRWDVAMILAAVGGGLGAFGATLSSSAQLGEVSTGITIGSVAGAIAILAAFRILPQIAPSLVRRLPGRPAAEER